MLYSFSTTVNKGIFLHSHLSQCLQQSHGVGIIKEVLMKNLLIRDCKVGVQHHRSFKWQK